VSAALTFHLSLRLLDRVRDSERPTPRHLRSCTIGNRLEYILLSRSLLPRVRRRTRLPERPMGQPQTRPTHWDTHPEMTSSVRQASDRAAVAINLDILPLMALSVS
jgi:hypothetical protein